MFTLYCPLSERDKDPKSYNCGDKDLPDRFKDICESPAKAKKFAKKCVKNQDRDCDTDQNRKLLGYKVNDKKPESVTHSNDNDIGCVSLVGGGVSCPIGNYSATQIAPGWCDDECKAELAFSRRMHNMHRAGHAGKGHKLTWEEAKWLWRYGEGKSIIVDGRVLSTMPIPFDSDMVLPFPLDDLKVHGKVVVASNGRIFFAPFDFSPAISTHPLYPFNQNPFTVIRDILNLLAIREVGTGKAFEIQYRYEDKYFE